MRFAIDRIEENIIVLENLETSEILEIGKELIEDAKEKDIIILENGVYKKDLNELEKRKQEIMAKFEQLL